MTCKIEGLPEGWEVVEFRRAEAGDYYLGGEATPSQWYYDSSSNGTYVIVRRKEKTLAERFDEWVKANDIKVGSRVRITRAVTALDFPMRMMAPIYDSQRRMIAETVQQVQKVLPHCLCLNVGPTCSDITQVPFEVCEPVKKVLKPWDMDTMPERVKVLPRVAADRMYWARPTGTGHAVVGATNVVTYETLLSAYVQADGSPCGIEVEE